MEGHKIAPDNRPVIRSGFDHLLILVLSPELLVNVKRDAVEPAVYRRSEVPSVNSTCALDRVGVNGSDSDVLQSVPELCVSSQSKDGLVWLRDDGARIVEQPDRSLLHELGRFWILIMLPPLNPLAGNHGGLLVSLEEHRILFEKVDVVGAVLRKTWLLAHNPEAQHADRRHAEEAVTEVYFRHNQSPSFWSMVKVFFVESGG